YDRAFAPLAGVQVPTTRPEVESARHLYVLRLDLDRIAVDRAGFIRELSDRRIGSSVHFIPIHHHTYYRQKYRYPDGSFPVADREFERIVSLPLSPALTDADVEDVVEAVSEIVERYARSQGGTQRVR
ncbi:MAG TPA: DegT/DnrJ/EryC1/StrS family aminotransferase, partial [Candidatus Dormibacteraeota bacterium]|nr:DegT/DnrJ/EryC1/StrS family aminotransferase [Candidatus Dormibacteraeota bacterium]